jgi:hypothetical protein
MGDETKIEIDPPAEVPAELWMLWNGADWVVSVDAAPGGTTYLVARSRHEAEAAAKHQEYLYDTECIPVRVR